MAKSKNKQERELTKLKWENRRLKRENAYLVHRLETISPNEAKRIPRDREFFMKIDDMNESKTYFSYLFTRFRLTRVYRVYDRIFFVLRKYFSASKIWNNFVVILSILGISIQSLLTFGTVLVLLPVTLILTAVISAVSIFSHNFLCKKMLHETDGKKTYFMFLRCVPRKNGIFYKTAQKFADDGATVLIVTGSHKLCNFNSVHKYDEGIYFIHSSFYFVLIKAMTKNGKNDIIKIF